MEENKDIFFAGGDDLVYLTGPVHKEYSTTFVWGHPFSTYDRCYNRFLIDSLVAYNLMVNVATHLDVSLFDHMYILKRVFEECIATLTVKNIFFCS